MCKPNKPLEKWTFNELCDAMAWQVVQAILKGQSLRDAMWTVCHTVSVWQKDRKQPLPGGEK